MKSKDRRAPELRVERWIGKTGEVLDSQLRLSDLGTGMKVLFAFQHWCSGCHTHGFPTLQRLHSALAIRGVGFAAIQTVFEGEHENTFEKLRQNQLAYGLPIAFGHDPVRAGSRSPSFMDDYRTRGTPWFAVIDRDGSLLFSDFHMDADGLAAELVRIEGEQSVAPG